MQGMRKAEIFDVVNGVILTLLFLIILYPLYFVGIASVSSPAAVNSGRVLFLPKGLTIEGYKFVLQSNEIWTGYANTIFLTIVGTIINLAMTMTGAYALSKSHLPFIRPVMFLFAFTMFFSGGMIPSYLLISRTLRMQDSLWALILPGAVSVYNLILVRTYYKTSIPDEILQAAKIDGCNHFAIYSRIILPLAKPSIVTMILFTFVWSWNDYMGPYIFISSLGKQMLSVGIKLFTEGTVTDPALQMSAATIVLMPVLALFLFSQKYFVEGVSSSAVKG